MRKYRVLVVIPGRVVELVVEGDQVPCGAVLVAQLTRRDLVRGVVDELKEHGRVIRGWMGFRPDDLTSAERNALGIEGDVGILLDDVFADGPSAAAGLRRGDVIIAINGEAIFSQRQARLLVAGTRPGDAVDVRGLRDGSEFDATIVVTERPP